MSIAIALSLISAVATAIARILAKSVLRFAQTRDYLSVNFTVLFLLLLPFAPFAFEMQISWPALGWLLVAAVIDGAANYFYFRSFEVVEVSTASALMSLTPLFTLLAAPLAARFAPTQLSGYDVAGVLITIAGVMALNRELNARASAAPDSPLPVAGDGPAHLVSGAWKRLFMPVATALMLGINVYTVKYIFTAQYMNPYTYYLLRQFIVAVMTQLLFRPNIHWVTPQALGVVAGRGVFVLVQWLAMLYAVQLGDAPVVKSVSEIAPIFVLILSAIFLKESITSRKVLGMALIIVGVVVITLG